MSCSAEDAARLIEACRELVSSLDVDEVMDRAARSAAELLGAEAARLLCRDEAGAELSLERVFVAGELKRPADARLPQGKGLVGLAAEGGGTISDDAGKDRRFDPDCDGVEGLQVRSLVTVPLVTENGCAGVIQAASSRAGAFGPDHLELLSRFADLAAAAVHNARMHRQELEVQRARRELAIAAEIQRSLFPTELPDTGDFAFDAVCLPAEEVGGDLYDVFPFPDGRFCAVLGDVSGKGVPAALYMTWMVAELRLLSERAGGLAEMMAEINRRLCARATRGIFVTLMAGLFSSEGGLIEVASAGHHPPLLRRADGVVEEVPYPSAPPLGITPGQTYPTACFTLARGEAALGFTDGVIEARDGDGQEFGLERLKKAFAEGSGPGTLRRILKRLARFTGGTPQRDDTTMVLIWRKDS